MRSLLCRLLAMWWWASDSFRMRIISTLWDCCGNLMWKMPSSVCAHSERAREVLIITFYYGNKSFEGRAPVSSLQRGLPYWEILHSCKGRWGEAKEESGTFKGHMFWWPDDTGDLWFCLLWSLEGICDSQSFSWEAGKTLKKTFFFNLKN